MKVFLDSADLDEVEKAYHTGVIDGVTTNPSLLKTAFNEAKKGRKKVSMEEYLTDLIVLAKSTPVSLEVTKIDFEGMMHEANTLYHHFNPIANNIVIKIPINTSLNGKVKLTEGIRAIRTLAHSRIPTNATLVFTPEQALLAAKAGATYVSLFIGRIDDYIRAGHGIAFEKSDYYPAEGYLKDHKQIHDNGIISGVDLVKQTVAIIKQYGLKTQVIAASIRNTRQFREVALAGAHIATVPFDVLMASLNHVKTQEGIKQFTDDIVSEYAKLASKK